MSQSKFYFGLIQAPNTSMHIYTNKGATMKAFLMLCQKGHPPPPPFPPKNGGTKKKKKVMAFNL